MKLRDVLETKVGCAPFWLPCFLMIYVGKFDGGFCDFPCPVRRIFNKLEERNNGQF